MNLENYIGVVPDFPKKGISFKDISPLLKNPEALRETIERMAALCEKYHPTIIVGPESRAFVFGAPLALEMGLGFVMARKAGKLPGKTIREEYALEYGTAVIEVPVDSFKPGDRVLLIDDILATGGTFCALKSLVEKCGATPVACVSLISLEELKGWEKIGLPSETLLMLSDSH